MELIRTLGLTMAYCGISHGARIPVHRKRAAVNGENSNWQRTCENSAEKIVFSEKIVYDREIKSCCEWSKQQFAKLCKAGMFG